MRMMRTILRMKMTTKTMDKVVHAIKLVHREPTNGRGN